MFQTGSADPDLIRLYSPADPAVGANGRSLHLTKRPMSVSTEVRTDAMKISAARRGSFDDVSQSVLSRASPLCHPFPAIAIGRDDNVHSFICSLHSSFHITSLFHTYFPSPIQTENLVLLLVVGTFGVGGLLGRCHLFVTLGLGDSSGDILIGGRVGRLRELGGGGVSGLGGGSRGIGGASGGRLLRGGCGSGSIIRGSGSVSGWGVGGLAESVNFEGNSSSSTR